MTSDIGFLYYVCRAVKAVIAAEEAAVVVIKRAYRFHLRRMYGRAFRATLHAYNLLRYKAATCITKNVRVRLARRQLKTEKFLVIIKGAHKLLLSRALLPTSRSAKKLFWYESEEHERMLYADYIDFMDRTGFDPPRCVVEDNIAEIATRIRVRENMLCTRVQKRWRGLLSRRMMELYRSECLWLRQLREGKVLAIQRMYRAHNARLKLLKHIYNSIAEREHKNYSNWRHEKKLATDRTLAKELVKSAYLKERAVELTARVSGRIEYGGTKMKDFSDSCYGDRRLVSASCKVVADEYTIIRSIEKAREARRARREYLMNRIEEHGPKGYGKRGLPPQRLSNYSADALDALGTAAENGLVAGNILLDKEKVHEGLHFIRESSRSHGMRAYFENELSELTEQVVEDAAHEAKVTPALLFEQFQNHNRRTDLPKFKNYRYPSDINTDKMAVLYEEIPRTKQKIQR